MVVMNFLWVIVAGLLSGWAFVFWFLKRVNEWYYVGRVGEMVYSLPPGDLGWPFLGNMLPLINSLRSGNPNAFIYNLVSRFGKTGIYKTHLFGCPSIIVCTPELCRRVLTNDETFGLGYPKSANILAGRKSLHNTSNIEHRRLRRIIANPINGHQALAMYIKHIEDVVINYLDEFASMNKPFELFTEMKMLTFKVVISIFMGSVSDSTFRATHKLYNDYHQGLLSMAIDIPGFAFHKALKDEHIVNLILISFSAGFESSAMGALWAIVHLSEHPEALKKAKEEQQEIMKRRPSTQKGLSLTDIKRMEYLAKAIDEMLRKTNILSLFREAKADVSINGYTLPKGWKVLAWTGAVHMDPETYEDPQHFNPSRWDNIKTKAAAFIPFGAGSRSCPGSDLGKLIISIFLHYFLLNYELKRVNPKSPLRYSQGPMTDDNCLAEVIKIPNPSVFLSSPTLKEITAADTAIVATSSGSSKEKSSKKKEILKAFLKSLDDSSDEDGEEDSEVLKLLLIPNGNGLGILVMALMIIFLDLKICNIIIAMSSTTAIAHTADTAALLFTIKDATSEDIIVVFTIKDCCSTFHY
ncbi:beta-amyrin 11-oxidase-like [Corylus avellana]|uniref:beta-amyrin 11-oxidase-like n=1 Tax=Corylus avellana TaxID=13451 RepID=UPI00286B16D8|nr:beta-amyrin 11-oxidase-like [Corylus avellana]